MTADFFGATLTMRNGSTREEKTDHGKEEQSEETPIGENEEVGKQEINVQEKIAGPEEREGTEGEAGREEENRENREGRENRGERKTQKENRCAKEGATQDGRALTAARPSAVARRRGRATAGALARYGAVRRLELRGASGRRRAAPLGCASDMRPFDLDTAMMRHILPCPPTLRRWAAVALVALALPAALLTGCLVPDQRHYVDGLVLVAPPSPREEIVGDPPEPGYVWLGGYWNWVGNRHEWVPGHWTVARPNREWIPYQWVRQGDGWTLKKGHWQRVKR